MAEICVHWWIVDSDKSIPFPDNKDPNVFGRNAFCKKCGEKTILKERAHHG